MASGTSTRLHPEPRGGSRIYPGFATSNTHCADSTPDCVGGPEFRDIAERLPGGLFYQAGTAGLMKKRGSGGGPG